MSTDDSTPSLVARARRGEASAHDLLARRYLRAAYAIALAIVRRPADAEDIAQEALVRAFEQLDQCREPERFEAWLAQIVRNQSRNALDKRRLRDVPLAASEPEPASEAANMDHLERRRLLSALDRLSEVQREVVLLHDLQGWKHAEIASALGLSEIMSRQHLFTARQRLRAELGRKE